MYDFVRVRLLNRSHANEIVRQAKGKFHPAGYVIVSGREPSICLATCRRNGRKIRWHLRVSACVAMPTDGTDNGAIGARTNFQTEHLRHLPQNAIRDLA